MEGEGDAWDAIRADDSIQYGPIEIPPRSEPPGWLQDIMEFFSNLFAPVGQAFAGSWPVVKWVLIAAAAAMLLYILYRLLKPVLEIRPSDDAAEAEWAPQEHQARALLEEADALAAQGDFDAATHLLLQRSVGHISEARPDWVEPSSTARELARLPALPEEARTAFAIIAERVETSLFALRRLGPDDWQSAREAYASFALQNLAAGAR
jgi:hypothetical protein